MILLYVKYIEYNKILPYFTKKFVIPENFRSNSVDTDSKENHFVKHTTMFY